MYNQNVELGKGLINFKSFFKTLMKQNYNGEITLETHRGKNAYNTAIKNKLFMDKYI